MTIWTRIKCSLSSSDLFSHGNGHDEAVNVGERQSLEKRYVSFDILKGILLTCLQNRQYRGLSSGNEKYLSKHVLFHAEP